MLKLPLHLQKIAFEDYGETSELRAIKLNELRLRIQTLPVVEQLEDLSDHNLIKFLRAKKFDVDKALKVTVEKATFTKDHPLWCQPLAKEDILKLSKMWVILEDRHPNGQLIACIRPPHGLRVFTAQFLKENPHAFIRNIIWFFETIGNDLNVQVCGMILINCFKGMSLWDNLIIMQQVPLAEKLAIFQYVGNCLGFRLKAFYIFEQPSFVNLLWVIARQFLSNKMRDRFQFCGNDYKRLSEIIPEERLALLPSFLGGDLDESLIRNWVQLQLL